MQARNWQLTTYGRQFTLQNCVPFNEAVYAACMRNFAFPSYALNTTYAMQMPSHFYLMHRKI